MPLSEWVALALGSIGICAAQAVPLSLHLRGPAIPGGPITIEGTAPPACDIDHHLQVFMAAADGQKRPAEPLFGAVVRDGPSLLFVPTFPFRPGGTYRVAVNCVGSGDDSSNWTQEFTIPGPRQVREVPVVEIAPSATELPANTLRFYVSFNADMRGRFSRRDISLRDDTGREQQWAFMSFGQELWSADGRRLTLLVDPGRIKRGVTANMVQGPPLEVGRRYVLSVRDRDTATQARVLTAAGFRIVEAERRALDPRAWKVVPPQEKTAQPLQIAFDRVMDRALLLDSVEVQDASGQAVPGALTSADGERRLQFVPDGSWQPGVYQIVFAAALEDVCGNRIGEALDHEIGATLEATNRRLSFRVE